MPKNIILFIGDGMGLAQITAARIWAYGSTGSLEIEKFPNTGFVKTFSESDYVTDSAAAATALATGVKTYNGAIGVVNRYSQIKEAEYKLENILDIAKRKGKKIGVITTTSMTHATPAAFYAHAAHRSYEAIIAEQLLMSNLDLALGGGRCWFFPEFWIDSIKKEKGRRKDKRNLIKESENKKWHYVQKKSELIKAPKKKKILGLFAYKHLKHELEEGEEYKEEPSLKELVNFAVKRFSTHKKGYVLIVEGGRIDHAAHHNDVENMLANTVAFDHAVAEAVKESNAQETLIIVTADHETGGLAINGYAPRKEVQAKALLGKSFYPPDHRRTPYLLTFSTGPAGRTPKKKGKETIEESFRSGHYLKDAFHTAVDVPILAQGPGSEMFRGFINNTDIAHFIAKLLGDSLNQKYLRSSYFKKKKN